MKLIDTSSWIESLRASGDAVVRQRVRDLLLNGEAAWCDMVRLELWNGARGDQEKQTLRMFERDIPNLPITIEVWELACDLSQQLRKAGFTAPSTDLLIIASARHHRVDLEHCDSHFDEIQRILNMI